MNNNRVRVAILGAALTVGPRHVETWQGIAGGEIVALVDRNLVELENVRGLCPGARVFCSQEELHASGIDVDVEIIALPTDLHVLAAIAAIDAGHDVAIEKPIATNAAELWRLLQYAHDRGRRVYPLFQRRFMLPEVARLVAAGVLGEKYTANGRWLRGGAEPQFATRAKRGVLADLGGHHLYQLWEMFGFPQPLSVSGTVRRAPNRQAEHWAKMMFLFEGCVIDLEVGWSAHPPHEDDVVLELRGTTGEIRAQRVPTWESPDDLQGDQHYRPRLFKWADPEADAQLLELPLTVGQAHELQAAEIIAWVRDGVPPTTSPERTYVFMRMLDAAYRAAETGTTVSLV